MPSDASSTPSIERFPQRKCRRPQPSSPRSSTPRLKMVEQHLLSLSNDFAGRLAETVQRAVPADMIAAAKSAIDQVPDQDAVQSPTVGRLPRRRPRRRRPLRPSRPPRRRPPRKKAAPAKQAAAKKAPAKKGRCCQEGPAKEGLISRVARSVAASGARESATRSRAATSSIDSVHPSDPAFWRACSAFLSRRGSYRERALWMIQRSANLARRAIAVRRADASELRDDTSTCSIGWSEKLRLPGGGFAAEYLPVSRPCPMGSRRGARRAAPCTPRAVRSSRGCGARSENSIWFVANGMAPLRQPRGGSIAFP